MSSSELSIASISNQKLENTSEQAGVTVLKKALDSKAEVVGQLISSATGQLPEGVGKKVNTVA